jgi:hypothetical protein
MFITFETDKNTKITIDVTWCSEMRELEHFRYFLEQKYKLASLQARNVDTQKTS